jgi:chemotaxis protein CheX
MDTAQETLAPELTTLEADAFVRAARNVLEVMLEASRVEAGEPASWPEPEHLSCVRATIGLLSNSARTLSVFFPAETERRIAQRLYQTTEDLPAEDVDDALGELANMFAGGAKALLSEIFAEDIRLSLPSVTRPRDEARDPEPREGAFFIPFESDLGLFAVLVTLGFEVRP